MTDKHFWVRLAEDSDYEPAAYDGNCYFVPGQQEGFFPQELYEVGSECVLPTNLASDGIVISRGEHDRLLERDVMLQALEHAGVDNWEGYGHAQELYSEFSKPYKED